MNIESIAKYLSVINKYAKIYENNSTGDDKNKKRKEALYKYKHEILDRIYRNRQHTEDIKKHFINGISYYYIVIGDYSFHVPVDELNIEQDDEMPTESIQLDNTNRIHEPTDCRVEFAIEKLYETYNFTPNKFISSYDAQWNLNTTF